VRGVCPCVFVFVRVCRAVASNNATQHLPRPRVMFRSVGAMSA
jgi:hypothetical protein